MHITRLLIVAIFASAFMLASSAFAHITLAVPEAAIGASYRAVFRVPHGYKGSATVKLSIQIPDGVIAVVPEPKPGWRIEIVNGKYDRPRDYQGASLTEGAKTVTWSGGNLPGHQYDEFILDCYLEKNLKAGATLYFPTVQACEQGVVSWIEIPSATGEVKNPAPSLRLLLSATNNCHY